MISSTPVNNQRRILSNCTPNTTVHDLRLNAVAVGSPLRRSKRPSIAPQIVLNLLQDDESERLKRRTAADVERRITNVTAASIKPRDEKEVQAHFQLCLKLFVDNKINCKNVWDLKLIEYINAVLESQKQTSERLQVGSSTLDIGSKIYSLKVDDTHTIGLKLCHNMGRASAQEDSGEVENVVNYDAEENDKENRPAKKKKKKISLKNKSTIVKDMKTISGAIPKVENNCFQTRRGVDTNSISDMFTNTVPIHPFGHKFMHMSNERAWMSYDDVEEQFKKESQEVKPWGLSENIVKERRICSAFSDFEIDKWDPEQDSHLMDITDNTFNNVVVFDDKGCPIAELDGSIHNLTPLKDGGSDEMSSDEERVDAQAPVNFEPEFITDFRPEDRNTILGEYSYANFIHSIGPQFQSQLLAGPSHWKLKYIRPKTSKFSGVIEEHTQKQQKKRKKEEQEMVLDVLNSSLYDSSEKCKIRKNPIKYDPERIIRRPVLFEEKFLQADIPFLCKQRLFKIKYVNDLPKDGGAEGEVRPYNYQNPEDAEYCSQHSIPVHENGFDDDSGPPEEEEAEHIVEGHAGMGGQSENLADVDTLLMNHLVDAPEMVRKNFVPYALQPKKLNMKKLKSSVWRCLVTIENSIEEKEYSEENLKDFPVRPTRFVDINRRVLNLVSSSMKDELSCATTFVALLHLTNEHFLKIKQEPNDLRDFEVSK